jgi:hypothetical protein
MASSTSKLQKMRTDVPRNEGTWLTRGSTGRGGYYCIPLKVSSNASLARETRHIHGLEGPITVSTQRRVEVLAS